MLGFRRVPSRNTPWSCKALYSVARTWVLTSMAGECKENGIMTGKLFANIPPACRMTGNHGLGYNRCYSPACTHTTHITIQRNCTTDTM